MRRIISVLIENESGALSRLVGLFSQRGYNIETLTVAPRAMTIKLNKSPNSLISWLKS